MSEQAINVWEISRALGNPLRWSMFCLLCGRSFTPTEIGTRLLISSSVVSHHLGIMRIIGLVEYDDYGATRAYRLSEEGIRKCHMLASEIIERTRTCQS